MSEGCGPQVPEEQALCQDAQQEGPKEDQASTTEAVSTRAEATEAS